MKPSSLFAPLGVVIAAVALAVAALAAPSPAAADHHGGSAYGSGGAYGSGYGSGSDAAKKSTTPGGYDEKTTSYADDKIVEEEQEFRNFGGVPIAGATNDLRRRKRFLGGDN